MAQTWKKCFNNIEYKMPREVMISQKQCTGLCSLGFSIAQTLNGADRRVQAEKEGGEILEDTDGGGGHCRGATYPGQPLAQPPSLIIKVILCFKFTKHLPSATTQLTVPWSRRVFWVIKPRDTHPTPFRFLLLPGVLCGKVTFSSYQELIQKIRCHGSCGKFPRIDKEKS